MGKTIARIENGIVTNLEWVNDDVVNTDDLKDVYDLQVEIGDIYSDGAFYRNNVQIVPYRQQIRDVLAASEAALVEIETCISITAPASIDNDSPPTIEERKQIIIAHLNDILEALKTMEVEPSE